MSVPLTIHRQRWSKQSLERAIATDILSRSLVFLHHSAEAAEAVGQDVKRPRVRKLSQKRNLYDFSLALFWLYAPRAITAYYFLYLAQNRRFTIFKNWCNSQFSLLI